MRRILALTFLILLVCFPVWAGQIVDRHNFFNYYDPTSDTFVYSQSDPTSATGDAFAVNTYAQKTIQVSGIKIGEVIDIRIEGRSLSQTNTPNWAILDTAQFGESSKDKDTNFVIDVTEFVDFIRVGIRRLSTDGVSKIDIEGLFTNLER